MSDTRKVVLAYPFTDDDGREFAADEVVELAASVANDLIYFGRARVPEVKATKATTTSKEK